MEQITRYRFYKNMANDIKVIAKNYFIALKRRKMLNRNELRECLEFEDDFEKHIRRVRAAYNSLDALEKTFINNDFFYQSYPEWWKTSFSKTTYYRLRRQSMIHFKEVFDNEA